MHATPRSLFLTVLFVPLAAGACPAARGADESSAAAARERALIDILRSDAPEAEKAITCKKLALFGSKNAVPALAPLLLDEKLSSWARIALEAIPGSEADRALLDAMGRAKGRQLVGIINSLGVRRSAEAVDTFTAKLKDGDAEIASSAAIALGHIGGQDATKALRAALATVPANARAAVAEGCILCAEQLAADGKANDAADLYDTVRKAAVPKQRVLEATRGAILARKGAGLPLLLEQLRSPDKARFQIGLSVARELPGREVSAALTAEIGRAAPERAALLLVALYERSNQVVSPEVLETARTGTKASRLAALGVLRRAGDADCLDTLLEVAVDNDAEIAQAAQEALAEMPDKKVDAEIVARLDKNDGKTLAVLVAAAGQRRLDAAPALAKALENADPQVRRAALAALGATVRIEELPILIERVAASRDPEDAPAARQALRAACVRMPDREACAGKLAAALGDAPVEAKLAFLEALGAMEGATALSALAAAGKDSDARLQDVATRMLGQWMTIEAAPVLLDLARNAPGDKYKIRALRGATRIARQFIMPDRERADLCREALAAASRSDERKLVLAVLERYPNVDTLSVAVKAMEIPAVKQDASRVAASIARRLAGPNVDAAALLARLQSPVRVEIVKAEYGHGATQKDVTEAIRKAARDLPLIVLPSPSYNESLGGDPLPGMSKQLRIEYRINGAAGKATFGENAAIVLPAP